MPRHGTHLLKLTWVEIKIFLREPMGAVGTVLIPVVLFVVLGRVLGGGPQVQRFVAADLPVFGVMLIVIGAVLSLTTILAIYREGGILKRLKATPLSPLVILGTHVVVKLLMTSLTLVLLVLAGRQFFSGLSPAAPLSFSLGVLLVSVSLLSLGFVLASLVGTARFAQPLSSILLYTLLSISGLIFPVARLPAPWRAIALASPLTHGVALLRALWAGAGWSSQWLSIFALVVFLVISMAVAGRIFRWE